MLILFYIFIFIFGACMGSFLCCQVRRLYRRSELAHSATEKVPRSNSKKSSKTQLQKRGATRKTASKKSNSKPLPAHSICLSCRGKLKWYDNIPIISWLTLKGRCRKCHTKIGLAEILSELLTALALLLISVAFLAPYTTNLEIFPTNITPFSWAIYIITILLVLSMIFLAIYDALYKELPVFALIISTVFAALLLVLKICRHLSIHAFTANVITDPIFAVLVLGGLYLVLYLISKGSWVGDGDCILGAIIGLALGTPWLALIALFISNLTATVIMYPTVKGKNKRKQKIPFGPFLVAALILTITFADIFNSIL